MVDFQDLKERLDLLTEVEKDLGPGKKSGRWVSFRCPFPGHKHGDSKPSLSVTPDNGRYYCFTCGRSGDLVTWLREYREMSWKDIHELAGSDDLPSARPHPAPPRLEPTHPPAETWQSRGLTFVDDCALRLWQPEGARALAWLQEARGLAPDTIRRYKLGYHSAELYEPRTTWGLPDNLDSKGVWLPRGITIPCFVGGVLWYVNIRRPDGKPKYYKIADSKAALFGADNLRGADLVLLTEGEFDCILADQELGDVAGVASLGSASNRLYLTTWGTYLLPAFAIITALDVDQAGQRSTVDLVKMSCRIHPVRVPVLRPGDKDLTDYHQAGGDLWEWLKYHLDQLEFSRLMSLLKSQCMVGLPITGLELKQEITME